MSISRLGRARLPPNAIITSPVGYVRLLGRKGDDWTDEQTAADYLYTPPELGAWQSRIERLRQYTSATFVIAANHPGGKAAINAMQLRAMLRETDCAAAPPHLPDAAAAGKRDSHAASRLIPARSQRDATIAGETTRWECDPSFRS